MFLKIESSFILPITSMTKAADDFVKNIGDQKAMDECGKEFEKIDIRSENEVGDLYRTISKMESDMAKQLYDIRQYADNTIRGSDPVRHWRIGGV